MRAESNHIATIVRVDDTTTKASRSLERQYWYARLARRCGMDGLLPGQPLEGGQLQREMVEAVA